MRLQGEDLDLSAIFRILVAGLRRFGPDPFARLDPLVCRTVVVQNPCHFVLAMHLAVGSSIPRRLLLLGQSALVGYTVAPGHIPELAEEAAELVRSFQEAASMD